MAKLQLTVDFPSAGRALDVTKTLAGFSDVDSRIRLHRARYASAPWQVQL